jgi:hypothetical protein
MDRIQLFSPEERADFKRCRRAWDFGAGSRRGLEPIEDAGPIDADRLIRDALAVYYFPGMWDWARAVVLPVVTQALDRGLQRQRDTHGARLPADFEALAAAMQRLLVAYFDWAPGIERLSPVLVEVDYQVDLPDPDQPDAALRTSTGTSVRYRGRVDLLAVDEFDAYWIVRHRLVDHWSPVEVLQRDEEALASCWAWEHFYLGMTIAGTIHNELRPPADFEPDAEPPAARPPASTHERRGIPQSEGSGGGRSVPQHRRLYARSHEPVEPEPIIRDLGPWFRRTWIRRPRAEIEGAGRQLAREAREILDPGVIVYPSPSQSACPRCPFGAPCQALYDGDDAEAILAAQYQRRDPGDLVEGRLGGTTWSTGRGGGPARFGQDRDRR